MARKPIGNAKRFRIFRRDKFTCQYCGRTPPAVILNADHIIAVANGGGDEETNLVTSCKECNAGKGTKSIESEVPALTMQLREQVERQKQFSEFNKFLMKARKELDAAARRLGVYWCNLDAEPKDVDKFCLNESFLRTLRVFCDRLPEAEIYKAIDRAASFFAEKGSRNASDKWKYFCGICWRKIKESPSGVGR